MQTKAFRIIFDIALLASLLFLPWWVTMVGVLCGIAYFPFFAESLFYAFALDALYGRSAAGITRTYPYSIVTAALFLISFWLKAQLRSRE